VSSDAAGVALDGVLIVIDISMPTQQSFSVVLIFIACHARFSSA
jgi:hypothetical protein